MSSSIRGGAAACCQGWQAGCRAAVASSQTKEARNLCHCAVSTAHPALLTLRCWLLQEPGGGRQLAGQPYCGHALPCHHGRPVRACVGQPDGDRGPVTPLRVPALQPDALVKAALASPACLSRFFLPPTRFSICWFRSPSAKLPPAPWTRLILHLCNLLQCFTYLRTVSKTWYCAEENVKCYFLSSVALSLSLMQLLLRTLDHVGRLCRHAASLPYLNGGPLG